MSGYEVVVTGAGLPGDVAEGMAQVSCPAGKRAIDGGLWSADRRVVLTGSSPLTAGAGWRFVIRRDVVVQEDDPLVYVICVTA